MSGKSEAELAIDAQIDRLHGPGAAAALEAAYADGSIFSDSSHDDFDIDLRASDGPMSQGNPGLAAAIRKANCTCGAGDAPISLHDGAGCPFFSADDDGLRRVLADAAAERQRQVEKGWTREHDDGHTGQEIVRFALDRLADPHALDERVTLVEVVAMLVAEVERLDRAAS